MIPQRPSASIVLALLLVMILPDLGFSQTAAEDRRLVEDRRIEEKKRKSLLSTEVTTPVRKEKKADRQKDQHFDRLELAYLMDVMQRKITYGYDACKAVVLLKEVENQYIDLNSQLAYLRENKILPKKYAKEFDMTQPLRKGLFAYMLVKTLNIKGGIGLRLFGVRERYALKELAYEGILADSNKNDLVSGDQFVVTMMQAASYLEKRTNVAQGPV